MSFENEGDPNEHQYLEVKTENPDLEQDPNILSNQDIKQENFDNEILYNENEYFEDFSNEEIVKCELCNEVLESQKTFRTHILEVHGYTKKRYDELIKPYKCPHCPASFARKEQCKVHISGKHLLNPINFWFVLERKKNSQQRFT